MGRAAMRSDKEGLELTGEIALSDAPISMAHVVDFNAQSYAHV